MCELMKQQETHLKQQVRLYSLPLCLRGPHAEPHPVGREMEPSF